MTYQESAALMLDQTFRGRVKVAAIKFADSILNESVSVTGHVARVRWAQQTFAAPDVTAGTLQPPAVMDAAVQSAGANITDPALQSAVEAVVNKMI